MFGSFFSVSRDWELLQLFFRGLAEEIGLLKGFLNKLKKYLMSSNKRGVKRGLGLSVESG